MLRSSAAPPAPTIRRSDRQSGVGGADTAAGFASLPDEGDAAAHVGGPLRPPRLRAFDLHDHPAPPHCSPGEMPNCSRRTVGPGLNPPRRQTAYYFITNALGKRRCRIAIQAGRSTRVGTALARRRSAHP